MAIGKAEKLNQDIVEDKRKRGCAGDNSTLDRVEPIRRIVSCGTSNVHRINSIFYLTKINVILLAFVFFYDMHFYDFSSSINMSGSMHYSIMPVISVKLQNDCANICSVGFIVQNQVDLCILPYPIIWVA